MVQGDIHQEIYMKSVRV